MKTLEGTVLPISVSKLVIPVNTSKITVPFLYLTLKEVAMPTSGHCVGNLQQPATKLKCANANLPQFKLFMKHQKVF